MFPGKNESKPGKTFLSRLIFNLVSSLSYPTSASSVKSGLCARLTLSFLSGRASSHWNIFVGDGFGCSAAAQEGMGVEGMEEGGREGEGRGNVTPSGVEREREREMLFEIQSISPSDERTDGRTVRPTAPALLLGGKTTGKREGRREGAVTFTDRLREGGRKAREGGREGGKND